MSQEHLNQANYLARRPHKCARCGDDVLKGESHTVVFKRVNGKVHTFRFHTACGEAATAEEAEGR